MGLERLTSPRRRQDRPIESVALRISFSADRKTLARMKEDFPSAKVHGSICEVRFEAEHPAELAEKAKLLLEKIRTIV